MREKQHSPASADTRGSKGNSNRGELAMVLLASNYDKSRFLKAVDLSAPKKLKIRTVTEELIGQGADQKRALTIWFTNDERGLPLNITNLRTLRGAFGDACDGWAGKIIVIFPTTTDLRGRIVPCLRVRIPPPKGNGGAVTAKPPEPELPPAAAVAVDDDLDDEINF